MKTINTIAGNVYCVTSKNGGTLTDSTGTLNETVEPGKQVHVTAPSNSLLIDDDEALMRQANFNHAALALGLLGGGKNNLPAGYTKLDFIASTGTQYLALPVEYGQTSGLSLSYKAKPYSEYSYLSIIRYSGKSVQLGRIYEDGKTGIATSSPTVTAYVANNGKIFAAYNEYESKKMKVTTQGDESETDIPHTPAVGETVTPLYLMAYDRSANLGVYLPSPAHYSLYEARFTLGKQLVHQYVPALDPTGAPCMFDLVSKQPFKNEGSGQFVAGVASTAQLRSLLSRLSLNARSAETLTLSLPAEANTPEVAAELQACQDRTGWTLTVHEYRPAAAATYSLRRVREVVWCRRILDKNGSYVDAENTRWQVERCAAIYGPLGQDPTAYGYEPFDSEDAAAEAWGLTPYQYPEEELTETE